MRFDELASEAGRAALAVGRRAERPDFVAALARSRRRSRVTAWSAVAAVVSVVVVVGVLVSSSPGPQSSTGAPAVTTTTNPDTGTTPVPATSTTTLADEPTQPALEREECPITYPGNTPFAPPSERELSLSFDGVVWYGTPELWTFVQEEGQVWEGLPVGADGSLTQKTFWWTDDYVVSSEPVPKIAFFAADLSGSAPTVEAEQVTSGGHPEMGVFIIAGFEIPREGCWQITAQLIDVELSYVAWVEGR